MVSSLKYLRITNVMLDFVHELMLQNVYRDEWWWNLLQLRD